MLRIGIIMVVLAGLLGCGGAEHGDLKQFIQDLEKQEMPPLPKQAGPIASPEVQEYRPTRDPFRLIRKGPPPGSEELAKNCKKIDHVREDLEEFALDSLRMVGTMQKAGKLWAIIRDPSGVIHNVQIGDYLGQNNGKIKDISEAEIHLVERIEDGNEVCGWNERAAVLALVER